MAETQKDQKKRKEKSIYKSNVKVPKGTRNFLPYKCL